jgi:high-affinity Fe2+/Pb2+ permease
VKKRNDRYKGQSSFSLQARCNMETVLIVLVVLFLLGGGGWGYSRWRG